MPVSNSRLPLADRWENWFARIQSVCQGSSQNGYRTLRWFTERHRSRYVGSVQQLEQPSCDLWIRQRHSIEQSAEAGHYVVEDEKERAAEALVDFLDRHDVAT